MMVAITPGEAAVMNASANFSAPARLLAIVADVDAGLELAGHHMSHGRLGLAREGGGVYAFAPVLAHEQVAQRRRAGKAAGMGGQDPLLAALHGRLGYTMPRPP